MKLLTAYLLPALASASALVLNNPEQVPDGSSVAIDHAFGSISFPIHFLVDYVGSPSTPNLFTSDIFTLLKNKTGAWPRVRVGGTSTDSAVYVQDLSTPITFSSGANGIPKNVTIGSELFEVFSNLPDIHWTIQLPMASPNKSFRLSNALAIAKATLPKIGSNLDAFEIGNEPDLYPITGLRPSNWSAADLVQEWLQIAQNVSSDVLAGNTFGLPDRTFFQGGVFAFSNLSKVLTIPGIFEAGITDGDYVKSISHHEYFTGSPSDLTLQNAFMNHMAVGDNVTQYANDMETIQKANPNITFNLGETNSDYVNLGLSQYEGVFGNALWMLDYQLTGMLNNITHYNIIQGTTFGYAAWVPVSNGTTQASVRPPFYGHIAAADILGPDIDTDVQVASVPFNTTTISTYAVYENGTLSKYVLINLQGWNSTSGEIRPSQDFTIQLPSSITGATSASLTSSMGQQAVSDITWAGQSYSYENGRLSVSGTMNVTTLSISSGSISLSVPATEAVVITLSRGSNGTTSSPEPSTGAANSLIDSGKKNAWTGLVGILILVLCM